MAFPLPALLGSIEELLQEVQWLDGLILVTDSQRTSFVSFAQVDPVLCRLRAKPNGNEVAERLCLSLLEAHGKGGSWGHRGPACLGHGGSALEAVLQSSCLRHAQLTVHI